MLTVEVLVFPMPVLVLVLASVPQGQMSEPEGS